MTTLDLFYEVSDALLEPGGLVLGITTEVDYFQMYQDTLMDFLSRTELVKHVTVLVQEAGKSTYDLPEDIARVTGVMFESRMLPWSAQQGVEIDPASTLRIAPAESWRADRSKVDKWNTVPRTPRNGPQAIAFPAGAYGVISSVVAGNMTISAYPGSPCYGVPQGDVGKVFVATAGPALGVISGVRHGFGNLTVFGAGLPVERTPNIHTIVELVDDFTPYLWFGVMERIFSTDGEHKDMLRSRFCSSRYNEGIQIAKAIVGRMDRED